MNPIQLLSGPLSMFGMKVHIAMLEKALPFELTLVPYTAERGYHPKHPDVLRINPKGQVPVLIHGDVEIFDSTQIFEYLETLAPTPALWPSDIQSRATARLLEHKSDEVFFPHIIRLMQLQAELEGSVALAARGAAAAYYREMDALLQNREFLAGPYSYADIAFFMAQLFAERLGVPMTGATPQLATWRARMTARPAVRRVLHPLIAYLAANNRPIPTFLQSIRDG